MISSSDVIVFSARPESSICKTLLSYSSIFDNVFLSRHPQSEPLSRQLLSKLHLVEPSEESNVVRIYNMLCSSNAKNVYLAGDDDFILFNSAQKLSSEFTHLSTYSSASIYTLNMQLDESNSVHYSPYSNSPLIYNRNVDLNDILMQHFSPLSIDFFTIYDRQRFKFILKIFIDNLDPAAFDIIGYSGKSFQYILAFCILLTGSVYQFHSPLYVRGTSPPLRNSRSASKKNLIDSRYLRSLSQEANLIFSNPKILNQYINCLFLIYSRYGYSSMFNLSNDPGTAKLQLRDLFTSVFRISLNSINTSLVSMYRSRYTFSLAYDSSLTLVSNYNNNMWNFHVNPSSIDSIDFNYILKKWPDFCLALLDKHDLQQLYDFNNK